MPMERSWAQLRGWSQPVIFVVFLHMCIFNILSKSVGVQALL